MTIAPIDQGPTTQDTPAHKKLFSSNVGSCLALESTMAMRGTSLGLARRLPNWHTSLAYFSHEFFRPPDVPHDLSGGRSERRHAVGLSSGMLGPFPSKKAAKWQCQLRLVPLSTRRHRQERDHKKQSTRIVLTRCLLQMAF